MAKRKLIIPKFASEADGARRHDRHKRELEKALEQRIREGSTLTLQQAAARMKLRPVTIRLPVEDIDAARGLAARKGIAYQTCIRMLLREALQREARRR
ncbi:MAG TPA: hypothetical protein VL523_16900 [Terriglobia bacterium]|nr:hypothetical protein [Terriglobia bacterium]